MYDLPSYFMCTMSQVAKSAQDRDQVFAEAAARLRSSEKLRSRMGGEVQVGPHRQENKVC